MMVYQVIGKGNSMASTIGGGDEMTFSETAVWTTLRVRFYVPRDHYSIAARTQRTKNICV